MLLDKNKIATYIKYILYTKYMTEATTIRVTQKTKQRLNNFGIKGDSYDDILNRLMDRYRPIGVKPRSE